MAASPRGDEELQHAEIGAFASGPLGLPAVRGHAAKDLRAAASAHREMQSATAFCGGIG
jgi:hypothetical protein